MSHKPLPLVTVGSDDVISCTRHFAPFWAVMLVGRDTKGKVNMAPHMEEYVVPHAVAKNHGPMTLGSRLSLHFPFITNTRDLAVGELLALPYDGGHTAICCDDFPSIAKLTVGSK